MLREHSGREPRGGNASPLRACPQTAERPDRRQSQEQHLDAGDSIFAGVTKYARQCGYTQRPGSIADLGRSAYKQHHRDRHRSGEQIASVLGYSRPRFHEGSYDASACRTGLKRGAGSSARRTFSASVMPNGNPGSDRDRRLQGKAGSHKREKELVLRAAILGNSGSAEPAQIDAQNSDDLLGICRKVRRRRLVRRPARPGTMGPLVDSPRAEDENRAAAISIAIRPPMR